MPKKICNQIGCNELINMSETHCSKHMKSVNTQRNRDYNRYKRNKKHDKFYQSSGWKVNRDIAMSRTGGLCEECMEFDMVTQADVVDHIISLDEDYSKRLDLDNLRPLCHSHHNKKTAEDLKK